MGQALDSKLSSEKVFQINAIRELILFAIIESKI